MAKKAFAFPECPPLATSLKKVNERMFDKMAVVFNMLCMGHADNHNPLSIMKYSLMGEIPFCAYM